MKKVRGMKLERAEKGFWNGKLCAGKTANLGNVWSLGFF